MDINFKKINKIFKNAENADRNFLLENEVYDMLKEIGVRSPNYIFLEKGQEIESEKLSLLKTNELVLKIVSPEIIHKTDVGGVRFVENNVDKVNKTYRRMLEEIPPNYVNWIKKFKKNHPEKVITSKEVQQSLKGILICESIDYKKTGFGTELLLGIRTTREFGPVLSFGIGGIEVEFLKERIKEGKAVSIGSPHLLKKDSIESILSPLAVYEKLVKKFRGKEPLLKKEELINTYSRFIQLALYYSVYLEQSDYVIEEAEVNPFVISNQSLVPLDGMCRFSKKHQEVVSRPFKDIQFLLKPKSIAIIGVSEKMNLGHIILNNILNEGFSEEKVWVIKPGVNEIEGCRCVSSVKDLPETVDMFVLTLAAEQSYEVMKDIITYEKARSVIIIAGGIGEKEGTHHLESRIKKLINKGRKENKITPVVNGGNCLGIYSRPGKFDTTFVPAYKLYEIPRHETKKANMVYISQSGAFMISRMSNLSGIVPLYGISIGNQIDLSLSDYLNYFKEDSEARVFAVYIEGFLSSDGYLFAKAAKEILKKQGKRIVVYKSGRSLEGKAATSSHTASVAGEYDVCRSILQEAGVIVANDIFEFENYIKFSIFLDEKQIKGNKIGLISNAGFECVIMADNLKGGKGLELAQFSSSTIKKIAEILSPLGIDRLQDVRNPLDVTPVADDLTFARCVEAILKDKNVDCAVVSPVPMTPAMQTLAPASYHKEDLNKKGGIVHLLSEIFQNNETPFVVNIDSGEIYNPLVKAFEKKGIPCFRRSDEAVSMIQKWRCHSCFSKI